MSLLLLTDFYPPGFRAGGPSRSCHNLSVGLGASIPVHVLTRDRDLGSSLPYPEIERNQWTTYTAGVEVCYLSPQAQGYAAIKHRIKQFPGSVLYLNSMFSLPFTIYPILAHWLGSIQGRMVLAPRGMLKDSALQFKSFKKRVFLAVFRGLGWHKRVVFHATSQGEIQDIQKIFGLGVQVVYCPQVPEIALFTKRTKHVKSPGKARFCLVGRVHPIKQVALAIGLLSSIRKGAVVLDIIGPLEDAAYAAECKHLANELPPHVQVHFWGELPPEQTHEMLGQADFFYLLTQGENFGHAIFEALTLGKPVIISDQTPWRNLAEAKAGWDLPVSDRTGILQVLNTAIQMDDETYQRWSDGAFALARQYADESDWMSAYQQLFFPGFPETSLI